MLDGVTDVQLEGAKVGDQDGELAVHGGSVTSGSVGGRTLDKFNVHLPLCGGQVMPSHVSRKKSL